MERGLSLVIVNYFSEDFITPLVEKILSTIKIPHYEVIIISNSPAAFGWSEAYLSAHHIQIIDAGGNVGFGIGINMGVAKSRYDIFCMVNPDIEIEDDTIDGTFDYFITQSPEFGAISPMTLNRDGSRQETFFMNKSLDKKDFFFLYLKNLLPGKLKQLLIPTAIKPTYDFSKPFEVGGFYCPFVMMRKAAFLDVGGFDPDFFMYAEDNDLFRNRFPKKYKCLFYPLVSLTHFSGQTDKYSLMKHQLQVSYLLYLRKAGNYFLFVHVVGLSLKYALLLLSSLVKKRDDVKEATGFFKALKYLKTILRYPRGYHTLPTSLKINEIPD